MVSAAAARKKSRKYNDRYRDSQILNPAIGVGIMFLLTIFTAIFSK